MGQMNDKSLDRHFAKQLRMMTDVYSSNVSKSDFMISQRWLHVFNMASNTQDKYARNCLILLMYGQLREMGKLGMPFISKRNERRPLVEVLTEYQGIDEADSDTEPEPEKWMQKGFLGEAEDRHQKLELGRAQLNKNMNEQEVLQQSRPEPKSEAQTNENVAQTMCNFSNIMHARGPELQRLGGGNQEMDFDNDVTKIDMVSLQDQEQHACALDSQQHYKQANSGWNRRVLQGKPLLETVSQKNHAHTLENQEHYKQANSSLKHRVFQEKPNLALKPHSTLMMLTQIKRDAQLAMNCLQNWITANEPLNFFTITLQHIVGGEPETRQQLFELDRKLETLLNNMLEQAGERREKNVRILYDHLFKQQQESLHEQRALNLAHQQLQDFKQHKNIFWQQQQDYYHHHHHHQTTDTPYNTTQERTSSFQYPKTPLDERLRSASSTFEVNICCGNDRCAVNNSASATNDTSASDSWSGICGCSECQSEYDPLSSTSSKQSQVRICPYCV